MIKKLQAVFLLMLSGFIVGTQAVHAQTENPEAVYRAFISFCRDNFGGDREEEIYRVFGSAPAIDAEGTWKYISESSACLAWRTTIPSVSWVEYGAGNFSSRTIETEKPYFLHLHYLRNLVPGETYSYRLAAVDERGSRIESAIMSLTTERMENAIRIPDDLDGPPYTLTRADATYLVTRDIVSDSSGINIAADGITLDLGGRILVYDEKPGARDISADERLYGWYAAQGPCGIRTADRKRNLTIVNGYIRQGAGRGASQPAAYNPLFLRRPRDTELAGITVEYSGPQVTGIIIDSAYEGVRVHHNVVIDKGTEILNRHRGLDGILFNVEKAGREKLECHHNLIKRTRHRGLTVSSNCDIFSNEIYIDSYATNSYGIMYYSRRNPIHDIDIHHNVIFGTGYHPIGIGAGFHAEDIAVYDNYIQMQGVKAEERWSGGAGGGDPAGQLHPVNGIRVQKGPQENIEYRNNTIVIRGRGEGCMMRGLWLVPMERMHNVVFRGNLIKTIAEDRHAEGCAIAALGADPRNPDEKILLAGNTVISNLCNIRFGDNYGQGGKYTFHSNTLVRIGDDPRYKTIRLGWDGWKYESYGHLFFNTVFKGGGGFDSFSFDGGRASYYDFSVGWTLNIRSEPGAELTITDRMSREVFTSFVPKEGNFTIDLVEYVQKRDEKLYLSPYKITATKNGKKAVREIILNGKMKVEIVP